MSRGVIIRIGLFLAIAALGLSYVGARYAGLDRLFGTRGFLVTLQLADSGGIFTNAEVTYRGVAVGRVGQLHLTERGLEVELDIEHSAPRIPADTEAVVATRSAVGEQYVDLRPKHTSGPYLAEGSVIEQQRTTIPAEVSSVLADAHRLVKSVPVDSLRTVVGELNTAFADAGPDLQRLLDSADSLTRTAIQHLPQTKELLANAKTVLGTQEEQSRQIVDYSRSLRELADQLRRSDPDLRVLAKEVPEVAARTDDLLRRSGTGLSVLLANLLTTSRITSARTAGLEQLLVAFPVITATSPTASGDGTGHLGLVLNFFDPFSCTKGYEGTKQRPGKETTDAPLNNKAYCAEPPNSPTGVRGSQNAPFGGRPVVSPPARQQQADPGLPGPLGLLGQQRGPRTLGQLLGLEGR
ncbi:MULTISPECIES: MCE family protein [unclassified Crossiella]|uniref:MCE family protein n=1 Tax=unclassified Crossiella TaxID=2620835 RepID=UPI001FFF592E|nr:MULTISPECIES: MCE family protein [unclassified Crossiella]MCK2241990.1 MCE family protein [Crossiella sp. S99.2]MCK2255893.1 MCE family protein [Crossiella sp. S99.1]